MGGEDGFMIPPFPPGPLSSLSSGTKKQERKRRRGIYHPKKNTFLKRRMVHMGFLAYGKNGRYDQWDGQHTRKKGRQRGV